MADFTALALNRIAAYQELMMPSVATAATAHVNMQSATRVTAAPSPTPMRNVCFAILPYGRHRTTNASAGAR